MARTSKATDTMRVPLALDGDLLHRIVDKRFPKGVTDFLDYWHGASDPRGRLYSKAPRNRATIYRWFRGDLPGSAETLVELAAILDIDPLSLFTIASDDPAGATAKILTALETGLWPHKSMFILSDFLGRRADWPPPAVGTRYSDGWRTFEFSHDPEYRSGVYGNFQITFDEDLDPEIPRIIHVAYRYQPHFGGRWLQYGLVKFVGTEMILLNINGSIETGFGPSSSGPFTVETVFGLGPAEFRLASLTPFDAKASYEPSSDPGLVGFR